MGNFEHDFLSKIGFDPDDPAMQAAVDDAQTHARLIETLVHVRNDRDRTQKDVAELMGTTQSRVSNFERIGGDPRLSTLLRYARAVDTKLRISVIPTPRNWAPVNLNLKLSSTTASAQVHYALDASWHKTTA